MDLDRVANCVVDKNAVEGGVLTLSCIPQVFQNIVVWLLLFAGVGALFFLILGGYKFITSGGDAKSAEGARKTITYAIIGLLLILLSFFIINSIAYFTGVGCITKFGFGCS
ncbi:MAG: hypothetical protein HYT09_00275 [Candidatus Levybacteria bacterium]|nr:hypothetical protein [Candidatus Levybacteria bacterium]